MEWAGPYLDAVLVPCGLAILMLYHLFLIYKVRTQPYKTAFGIGNEGRRLWVREMAKDNEKKQILGVQSVRNSIMESTVMATTAILLSAGLAAYMTYTSNVKQPLDLAQGNTHLNTTDIDTNNDANTNNTNDVVPESIKLMSVLIFLTLSFFCQTLSISLINQVNYMVNIPTIDVEKVTSSDYLSDVMGKSSVYSFIGARFFYAGMPLLFWVFGSIPLFLACLVLIHCFYNLDFVHPHPNKKHQSAPKIAETMDAPNPSL